VIWLFAGIGTAPQFSVSRGRLLPHRAGGLVAAWT
jgi:hypothetical protein